ncbi:hypothetical protein ABB37_01254 [Leptomonas pyrrhocoris]|uniref:Uncharacterized protein n=1 Tax=Leptomonas pyrrhocoris TaxID=157538 RepID=A0A0M9G8E6_LEPPY|nr:hypothetical protein ABB37_01254 [Leptomonas pyrrhocoris]XP_015663205.1 hypothetical protein ABB37_01254 [Leptomonas pyrrhocoris]XP_015663206.1 hypothetical protein ABB37_01254 [Leptomonas pyrrhocoris]KPA84765.1 hypothetical protein ABB37_01254 [Leptomonas pyrrhocoris]KPA84766.1 hypothetical protein ABB37_01254 [Leptomonas pyrrhocoris]KPA84767.1 hypothetical protein ABB37_01254 [Leptomonas pyrrhocoris]|eukprot:XP_015663204.1 hypothetical protein ABB37_01254 [Leptomonas pyrrhocoris]
MAKKHRVKRQKYVDHLLVLEKKRDVYLAKRRAPKRSREARNDEEATMEGRELTEPTALKKRRTESTAAEQNASDEEEHRAPPRASPAASAKATESAAPIAAAAGKSEEKKAFFTTQPFAELVKASAAVEKSELGSAAKAVTAKKSLKRRHY